MLPWLVLKHCKSNHLMCHLLSHPALKSYFFFKETDRFWQSEHVLATSPHFSPHRVCLEAKIYVLKQSWIRHITQTAYRTWQVIPNYWKLENCSSIWSHWDIVYSRTNTKWSCLLGLFCGGGYFNVGLNSRNSWDLFFPSLFLFFPPLGSPHVISHLNDILCSPSKRAHTHTSH